MTVSSTEAETMTYRQYKVAVWGRLLKFWDDYLADHPDEAKYCAERLAVCGRNFKLAMELPR